MVLSDVNFKEIIYPLIALQRYKIIRQLPNILTIKFDKNER